MHMHKDGNSAICSSFDASLFGWRDGNAIIGGQVPTDPDANLLALGIASGATAVQLPFAAFAIGAFAAAVCRLN